MKITLVYEFDNREFEYEVDNTMDKDDLYTEHYDEAYEAYLEAKGNGKRHLRLSWRIEEGFLR